MEENIRKETVLKVVFDGFWGLRGEWIKEWKRVRSI